VLDLPGRGIDLTLNLFYNSLLWHAEGRNIYFDKDSDWPAPGWTLGFGKLVRIDISHQAMLIDADGTRHPYKGTFSSRGEIRIFNGHTTDGTLIDYEVRMHFPIPIRITHAYAKYPNGTVVEFGAAGVDADTVYPTRITDANGNYITVTYRNNTGPHIETITDTLGRVVAFHYDNANLLTAITCPGLKGGTRELVRLQYQSQHVYHNFADPIIAHVQNPYDMIAAIYYPDTRNGYWFAISTYGMLRHVSRHRGMSFTGTALTEQGRITPWP